MNNKKRVKAGRTRNLSGSYRILSHRVHGRRKLIGKFVMELVKRETHEEEKKVLFFPGARTRPREFSLPSKKPCIFYAGCNNQFALGKGIQQS